MRTDRLQRWCARRKWPRGRGMGARTTFCSLAIGISLLSSLCLVFNSCAELDGVDVRCYSERGFFLMLGVGHLRHGRGRRTWRHWATFQVVALDCGSCSSRSVATRPYLGYWRCLASSAPPPLWRATWRAFVAGRCPADALGGRLARRTVRMPPGSSRLLA